MGDSPAKWQKYQLMERFGLADTMELSESIYRYPWEERERLLCDIQELLVKEGGLVEEHGLLIVVKFVPKRNSILLPNVRIQLREDVKVLEKILSLESRSKFQEVWYCQTNVSSKCFSVAGRILVDAWGGRASQKIEQVWRCSPRLIESLGEGFIYPFVRASRPGWAWAPTIEKVYTPSCAKESHEQIRSEFSIALRLLDQKRDLASHFAEAVFSCGVSLFSLEYKIEGNNVQFIDWDTTDDYRVLDELTFNESK